MPAKAMLNDDEKATLREKLKWLCEQSWVTNGYKKTSVKEICTSAKIAIGTFYAMYPTKEQLFFETVLDIQQKLAQALLTTCRENPSKNGFAQALKDMVRSYAKNPFIYDLNKPDYVSFIQKLSPDVSEKIQFDSITFFRKAIQIANLQLKIDENLAYASLGALLSTIFAKDGISMTHDYHKTLDFMVDCLLPNIFE